jgi:hypothetical protein
MLDELSNQTPPRSRQGTTVRPSNSQEKSMNHAEKSSDRQNLWTEILEDLHWPKLYTYRSSVRNSQRTHFVSIRKISRLMLFRKNVAAYCKIRTKYTYIHTYINTYISTCSHTYMHTYVHRYVHIYIHTYIHNTYIHVHKYIHKYVHSYIHAYVRTQVSTYVHTYIHTFTHTITHTQTLQT